MRHLLAIVPDVVLFSIMKRISSRRFSLIIAMVASVNSAYAYIEALL